ncbi:MAG: hypothetical protein ACMUIE_00060 [Thermoplasmatota archaeon]
MRFRTSALIVLLMLTAILPYTTGRADSVSFGGGPNRVELDFELLMNIDLPDGNYVTDLEFSYMGDMLAVGCGDKIVYIYDTDEWTRIANLTTTYPVLDVDWCPQQHMDLFAVSTGRQFPPNGTVEIYSTSSWNQVEILDYPKEVMSIDWSLNGSLLAVSSGNPLVILNTADWTVMKSFDLGLYYSTAVNWDPSGDYFALSKFSSTEGSMVEVYNLNNNWGLVDQFGHFPYQVDVLSSETSLKYLAFGNLSLNVVNMANGDSVYSEPNDGTKRIVDVLWHRNMALMAVMNQTVLEFRYALTSELIHTVDMGGFPRSISWSYNYSYIAAGMGGTVALFYCDQSGSGTVDEDSDGDGVIDELDDFPDDVSASEDMDGDGHPNRWNPGYDQSDSTTGLTIDMFPSDPTEWNDSDGDGVGNNSDKFPEDPSEWNDTDGDGIGDNSDPFPNGDPTEIDRDGDGVSDDEDEFPDDPNEWDDTDNDGIGDNSDDFPTDPAASEDTDGDGYPDSWNPGRSGNDSTTGLELDMFPYDEYEWSDSDMDGRGDNSDAFPDNPYEWSDTDGDGSGDNSDDFPGDPAASVDSDSDGYPDFWNPGKSEKDSTTGLKLDRYPRDPKNQPPRSFWSSPGVIVPIILFSLLAFLLIAAFLVVRARDQGKTALPREDAELERYRREILLDRNGTDYDLSREEIKDLLKKRRMEGEISEETYDLALESIQ